MSKHPNEQDDVQASTDATDGVTSTDGSAPSRPATAERTQNDNAPSSSNTQNTRSRRRQKAKSTAPATAASAAAASSASTSSSSVDTPSANTSSASGSTADKRAPTAATTPSPVNTAKPAGATPPPSPPATPSGGHGGEKGKGSGKLALVLVVLVAILLVVAALFGWQQLSAQQQRIDALAAQTESNATQQSVSELTSRVDSLDSGEAERESTFNDTLEGLRGEFADYRSNVDETLDQVLTELSQSQDTDERDWLHAEVAYLLRLANQRLQLEGDVEGAAALLSSADERLVEADNAALTPVRREIANELAALDAVPRVDRTGIYLALNAQQQRIANLRLSQEIEEQAVTSGIEQPPTGPFMRQLARFGEELKDLVVIRHHDEAMETLVTPEQEAYLRQSLRLVLEQSQLALLREEQTLYETSLDKALELLNAYYDTSREETQSVIRRLQELKQNDVEPELPDISASQEAMTRFIEQRFARSSGGDE
ncbi:uroporphyrinogen-III C-methyltransferase [Halomonas dongshanensis]|uniref:Uroporphyrinogen-III C-methyltransferase n=1 Tax=Halomonas dongshanensis TaxID=2890835 RepID=A0ABT2E9Z0_9GAMM|nr:uroporphyrinogen-III C-methyltransferase [Halomonas dongshanensis]MCS2607910.1 uroporphyrinogen-III C-methyltransferase [Halomonas dongshanensis]